MSLRSKVLILTMMLITLSTTVLSLIIGWKSSEDFKMEVGNSLAATAYQMTSRLDQYMWGRAGEVRIFSELAELHDESGRAAAEALLNRLKQNFPAFSWLGVTDRSGNVWVATEGILVGQNIAQRPVFSQGIQGEFIGDVHDAVLLAASLPNPSGEPMKFVDISVPLLNSAGEKKGVMAAHLSWAWAAQLEESMFQSLQERKQEELFIVSCGDHRILLGPKSTLGQKLELESLRRGQNGVGWVEEVWPDGKRYITGFSTATGYLDFKGLKWTVLVRKPVEVAHKTAYGLQVLIWLLGGLFAAIFAVVSWVTAASVTRPLKKIAKAADRIRFGGTVEELENTKGIAEIEILSESLRQLGISLAVAQSELTRMEAIAHHDRLTGLPNRIGLDEFVEKAQAFTVRQRKMSLAILYLDLDGFKKINDAQGHAAGDLVLKEMARRFEQNVREDEFVARVGGDEFVIVLFVEKEKAHAMVRFVAERIIKNVNEPIFIKGTPVTVGCSIGCAFWSQGDEMAAIMERADAALYGVKKSGKNKVTFDR